VGGIVTSFEHQDRFSRRQAAELLADIAYELVAGGPLAFRIRGEQIDVPLGDELVLAWRVRPNGDGTELELRLSAASPGTGPRG
jgi:amphi-Trp domain-containing protein